MRSYVALVALAALSAAACGDGGRQITALDGPSYNIPIDDGGGGGGGGGGGETGGGGTPSPQYRVYGEVYKIDGAPNYAKVRGWSRFEQLVNGSWVKIDASTLAVSCAGGGSSDSDSENNAGFTDVEFWIGPAPQYAAYTVTCYHTATYAGVTYTATSSALVQTN